MTGAARGKKRGSRTEEEAQTEEREQDRERKIRTGSRMKKKTQMASMTERD